LKSGATLNVTNAAGESTTLRLVVDFVDYLPDPRPTFADNVRHSHPYGIVADDTHLYVIDAGFNNVRKVEIASGTEQTLASFPPTPSPLANGPPVIENVPTSIHWVGGQLVVTLLGGAPFLPGYSKVVQVHPQTGAVVPLIDGLTTAIDAAPLAVDSLNAGLLTLEHNLSFPQSGVGRLQTFTLPMSARATNLACLATPTSMLIDRAANRLILSELATGRLVWLPAPPSLPAGSIYWSEFNGGRISRANLDATGKVTVASGLSNPIGPVLNLARGQMYWGSSGTMRRANLDGTGQTIVVNGGTPALDLASGRMYFGASSGDIRSANLDGSDQQVLITGLTLYRPPVLDLVHGKIYWATFVDGHVLRANVDGTGLETLVAGLANSSLMALDVAGGKMYWTVQQANGEIRRANLDGTGQEILVRNQNAPAGIALDLSQGHLYWANYGGGDIRRANLDGTQQMALITGLSGPAYVALDLSVPPPLNIQTTARTNSGFTLSWNALMGRAYQVQFKSDLTQSNWTNLGGRVTATDTTMTAVDANLTDPQRFYRVQLLP
jgi:hypothetical protein